MSDYLNIMLYIQIGLSSICLYRIIRGPSIPDRMVGIDIFGILVVGICAIISVQTEKSFIGHQIKPAIHWYQINYTIILMNVN